MHAGQHPTNTTTTTGFIVYAHPSMHTSKHPLFKPPTHTHTPHTSRSNHFGHCRCSYQLQGRQLLWFITIHVSSSHIGLQHLIQWKLNDNMQHPKHAGTQPTVCGGGGVEWGACLGCVFGACVWGVCLGCVEWGVYWGVCLGCTLGCVLQQAVYISPPKNQCNHECKPTT